MEILSKHNEEWLEHHGKVITDPVGLRHRGEARTHKAAFPYTREVIAVSLVPLNKTHPVYQEILGILGDEWVTDALAMDPEGQAEMLDKLRQTEVVH